MFAKKTFPQLYLLGCICTFICLSQKGLVLFLKCQGYRPVMVLNVPPLDCHATPLDCRVIGEVDQKEV